MLEAIAGLCRGPDGAPVEATLRDHAPGWLRATATREAAGVGSYEPLGGTHEYTLHRLPVCLDALASDVPLALVLEDLQWSDYATLDLLSLLAHRREPARLLVLCTLRPADAIVRDNPVVKVKRELVRTDMCRELVLGGLPSADVEQYVSARFAEAELPAELVTLLVQRSERSPFFMMALVQHLLDRGLVVKHGTRCEVTERIESVGISKRVVDETAQYQTLRLSAPRPFYDATARTMRPSRGIFPARKEPPGARARAAWSVKSAARPSAASRSWRSTSMASCYGAGENSENVRV